MIHSSKLSIKLRNRYWSAESPDCTVSLGDSGWQEAESYLHNLWSLLTVPGIVCHELGHYLMARLTGREVTGVSLFQLSGGLFDGGGKLGFVSHAPSEEGPGFRGVLISLGPVVTGSVAVLIGFLAIRESLGWPVFVSGWLVFSIAIHMAPSDNDITNIQFYIEGMSTRGKSFLRWVSQLLEFIAHHSILFGVFVLGVSAWLVLGNIQYLLFAVFEMGVLGVWMGILALYDVYTGRRTARSLVPAFLLGGELPVSTLATQARTEDAPESVDHLLSLLQDEDPRNSYRASRALLRVAEHDPTELIGHVERLSNPGPLNDQTAIYLLKAVNEVLESDADVLSIELIDNISRFARIQSDSVRVLALQILSSHAFTHDELGPVALRRFGPTALVVFLTEQSPGEERTKSLVDAMIPMSGELLNVWPTLLEPFVDQYASYLDHPELACRVASTEIVSRFSPETYRDALYERLDDETMVSIYAARGLVKVADEDEIGEILEQGLPDD